MTIDDSINLSLRCQEPWMSKSFFVLFVLKPGPEGEGGGHPGAIWRFPFSCDFGESLVGWEIPLGYTPEDYQLETKKAAWKKKRIYTCTPNFGVPCEFVWGVYKLLAFQSKTQRRVRSSIELGRWSPVEVGSLSHDKFLRSQLVKDFTNSMGHGQCLKIRGPLKSPWNCHRNSILCHRWNSMEILDEIHKLLKHTPSHLYKGV